MRSAGPPPWFGNHYKKYFSSANHYLVIVLSLEIEHHRNGYFMQVSVNDSSKLFVMNLD
jgi:hypothetical protein